MDKWEIVYDRLEGFRVLQGLRDDYVNEQFSGDLSRDPVDGWHLYDEEITDYLDALTDSGELLADALTDALDIKL